MKYAIVKFLFYYFFDDDRIDFASSYQYETADRTSAASSKLLANPQ